MFRTLDKKYPSCDTIPLMYTYIPSGELVRGWMWCESLVAEGSGIDIVVWGSAKWIVADHPTTPIKKCPYSII
jgi:hypothetical protein